MKKYNILLCPGTYNPMTKGHMKAASYAAESVINLGLIPKDEKLYVVFSPVHGGYKLKKGLATANQRCHMVSLCVDQLNSTNTNKQIEYHVSSAESHFEGGFQPTWQVVDSLKREFEESIKIKNEKGEEIVLNSFMLNCGADLIISMSNPNFWPQINVQRLLNRLSKIIVIPRNEGTGSVSNDQVMAAINGTEYMKKELIDNSKYVLLDCGVSSASSSEVRARFSNKNSYPSPEESSELVVNTVREYIVSNSLYCDI